MTKATTTPRELGLPESFPLPKRLDWRIGIVGFGGIARYAHVPAYRSVGWNVAAIADPHPDARRAASDEFGIARVYTDHRDMLADQVVDVIDLCTQPSVREAVFEDATDAGIPMITEKPLAETIEECERMVSLSERTGVRLAVHQNYRWYKMCFLAREIISRGMIGEPFFASIEIMGQQDVGLADHPFYSKCANFLTVQWDNHLADLLRYWTGRTARRVLAHTGRMNGQNFEADGLLTVIADFGEGLTGHILHSELLRSTLGGPRCRVDGDKGSVVFDFETSLEVESSVLGGGPRTLDIDGAHYASSWAGSMGDLLLAIEEGREPSVSARDNVATIRTILAEDDSARSGGRWLSVL